MSDAREVFEEFLKSGPLSADRIELFCRDHPQHAVALRARWDAYARMNELLDGVGREAHSNAPEMRGTRYEIRGEIAHGGMGRVLEVWDHELRRTLAMKVLREDRTGSSAQNRSRLLNEAQILGQLEHAGIVPIHEVGCDADGKPYFTMLRVRGIPLTQVFGEVGGPDAERGLTRVVGMLLRVCQAMAHAHAKGVIHRDLKPANVMVGAFGEVFVMDWGLAKARGRAGDVDIRLRKASVTLAADTPDDDAGGTQDPWSRSVRTDRRAEQETDAPSPLLTMAGDVLGTPSYMAPEQAAGRIDEVDERSDIYSVGAMLYHLLSGRAPYTLCAESDEPQQILGAVLKGSPEPLRRGEGVPAELVAICDKAMAREPDGRYRTMEELTSELQAYLDGRVVSAYESGAVAAIRKWIRRNRALAAAVGASIVAVPVIASLGTYGMTKRSEAAENLRLFELLRYRVDLEEAQAAADALYPAWPENVTAMESWIAEHGEPLRLAHEVTERSRLEVSQAQQLFHFDGVDDHVVIAHATGLNPTPGGFTCEFWMKGTPAGELCVALDKSHGFFDNTGWAFQSGPEGTEIGFLVAGGGSLPYVNSIGLAPLGANLDGAWHHMAATWNGSTLRLYQDAEFQDECPLSGLANNTRDLFLGAAWCGGVTGRFFHGELADVAVHASALTPDVFAETVRRGPPQGLASDPVARAHPSTVALWRGRGDARDALGRYHGIVRGDVFPEGDVDAGGEQRRFLASTLRDLAADLDWFARHPDGALLDVQRRLDWARRVEELSLERHTERWQEARAAIAAADGIVASELYARVPIDLDPQMGLVPIGMNPATKLWEFYHLRTSADPEHIPTHTADGEIRIEVEHGIVFVLIPGGPFGMGASPDPNEAGYDTLAQPGETPVQRVQLDPFFLARHELTKTQWSRVTHTSRGDDTYPVHDVSWVTCKQLMDRLGLALPTEAQWEYSARAGSVTPWWSGAQPADLLGVANVADLSAWRADKRWPGIELDFDDGVAAHLRVGAMRANPWGLHEVHGNVLEWCHDDFVAYETPTRAGDGYRFSGGVGWKAARGGAFDLPAVKARSASRAPHQSWHRAENLGLRAARVLR